MIDLEDKQPRKHIARTNLQRNRRENYAFCHNISPWSEKSQILMQKLESNSKSAITQKYLVIEPKFEG